jgi:hypothetical protein
LIESLGVEGLAQEGQLLEESGLPEREDLEWRDLLFGGFDGLVGPGEEVLEYGGYNFRFFVFVF